MDKQTSKKLGKTAQKSSCYQITIGIDIIRHYGHEVLVANVRELHAIVQNISKGDQVDAEKLARDAPSQWRSR